MVYREPAFLKVVSLPVGWTSPTGMSGLYTGQKLDLIDQMDFFLF